MWYYLVMLFLIVTSLVITRLNTAYHPNLLLKKHVVIKSEKLQRWVVAKTSPENLKTHTPERDRNKLLYLGLIFYILWAVLLTATLVVWFVVPTIPTEPISMGDYGGEYYISTLNQVLPFQAWITYCAFDVSFWCLNLWKCNQDIKGKKAMTVLWPMVVVALFAVSFLAVASMFSM